MGPRRVTQRHLIFDAVSVNLFTVLLVLVLVYLRRIELFLFLRHAFCQTRWLNASYLRGEMGRKDVQKTHSLNSYMISVSYRTSRSWALTNLAFSFFLKFRWITIRIGALGSSGNATR